MTGLLSQCGIPGDAAAVFRKEDPVRTDSACRPGAGRGRTVSSKRWIVLAVVVGALVFPALAAAQTWGGYRLIYGSCCSGVTLDGTRAYVNISSVTPDSPHCVLSDSVVEETNATKQLETGLAKCGSTSGGLDGTCSLSNNLVLYVERYNGSSYTCYPHGAASTGLSYLATVDDSTGTGTWNAYLSGTLYEGQSGYDNNVTIFEWGEHTGTTSCTGWSDSTGFSSWQRYNYSGNTWTTVGSATSANTGCWTNGSLSAGAFSISH